MAVGWISLEVKGGAPRFLEVLLHGRLQRVCRVLDGGEHHQQLHRRLGGVALEALLFADAHDQVAGGDLPLRELGQQILRGGQDAFLIADVAHIVDELLHPADRLFHAILIAHILNPFRVV